MTTFTTADRENVQLYQQVKQLQLEIYELKKQIEFWKMKAEFAEDQVYQLTKGK